MKRTFYFLLTILSLPGLHAQSSAIRAYTTAELQRWSTICEVLSNSFPHNFKDYQPKMEKCGSFDWAERNKQRQPLTYFNKRNEAYGNTPHFNQWFSKDQDSVDLASVLIIKEMMEAKTPGGAVDQEKYNRLSAMNSKLNECKTLRVTAQTNITVDLSKQYAVVTKPVKLDLPIPAFAFLYTFPEGLLVLNDEGSEEPGTDAQAFYADKALVIISNTAPKVISHAPEGKMSWRYDQVFPQDKATEVLNEPVKNIVVTIDGAEADVRAFISQVNWKALQALLGK